MRCENCFHAQAIEEGCDQLEINVEVVLCMVFNQYRSATLERDCDAFDERNSNTQEPTK